MLYTFYTFCNGPAGGAPCLRFCTGDVTRDEDVAMIHQQLRTLAHHHTAHTERGNGGGGPGGGTGGTGGK